MELIKEKEVDYSIDNKYEFDVKNCEIYNTVIHPVSDVKNQIESEPEH